MRHRHLHYGWMIVCLGTLCVLAALGFARFGYTMILPGMKAGLDLNYAQMGDLGTGNFIGYLVFALTAGYLSAHFSRRRILLCSIAVLGLSLILTGLATSFRFALAARVLTGLASSGVYIPAMSLPAAWFAPHHRGTASGIQSGGSGFGLILTGLLVPWVMGTYGASGWRIAWFILGGLVLAIGLLCLWLVADSPGEMGLEPFGGTGPPAGHPPQADSVGGGPAKKVEPKERLQWGEVFGNPGLWHLGATYAMFGFSYVIYATFFAAYLTREAGLSEAGAGRLWSIIGLLSIGSGFVWGALADRIGKRYGLACVFCAHVIAFSVFALLRTPAGFYASTILFGLTAWAVPGIMAAACSDYVRGRLVPTALGFITIIFGVGQAAGPAVAGRLADLLQSFRPAFLLAAGASAVGLLSALALRPPR